MSNYPCSLTTSQGVTIRPLRLDDVSSIDAMHDRSSKDSLYYRYFTPYKPSLDALREQAQLSSNRGAAYVAVLQDTTQEIVGLAYYIFSSEDPRVAEPAVLIEDRYQGQGLGRMMMDYLLNEAQSQAVNFLQAFVEPTNSRILRLLERTGLPIERHYRDGVLEIQLSLIPRQETQHIELAALPVGI